MQDIKTAGFEVSALGMFNLDRANAEEFLEVYRGVVQEYPSMVDQIISGPCIALEIRAENAALTFREMAGPHDPVRALLPCICCIVFAVLLLIRTESSYPAPADTDLLIQARSFEEKFKSSFIRMFQA